MNKQVYTFGGDAKHDDPRSRDKTIVGGKGANLGEMAGIGLPVPPGFTITTEECVNYLAHGADFTPELRAEVATALTHIEAAVGKKFGDAGDPLLVSVRSGAPLSMPGATGFLARSPVTASWGSTWGWEQIPFPRT